MILKKHDTTIPVSEDPERTQIGGPVEVFRISLAGVLRGVAVSGLATGRQLAPQDSLYLTLRDIAMTEQKQPAAGEWWVSNKHGGIRRVVGTKLNGAVICEDDAGWHSVYDDFDDWHHEPLCTGFDWQPPASIDPGDDWELLPVGTVLEREDEFTRDAGKTWNGTKCYGERIPSGSLLTYRRRKPTAETWPKWYRWSDESLTFAFSRMADGTVFTHQSGVPTLQSDDWHVSLRGALKAGNLIEVTESEALARVKPAEPIAERISDNRPARDVIEDIVSRLDCVEFNEMVINARDAAQQWLEDNPEPVERTATPLVTAVGESPDDWVTQDRVPARDGIDRGWWGTDFPIHELLWWLVSSEGSAAGKMHGHTLHDGQMLNLRCRRRDLPAPPVPIDHERWFMWSDDRYPIAFVKRAGGKVFNLNVDGMFKTSDDWGASYEEKLINGEMIEVTEESAKAYLKRQRRKIIDPPAPQPKRTPVRLYWYDGNIVGRYDHSPPTDPSFHEIKFDGGFYVAEGE